MKGETLAQDRSGDHGFIQSAIANWPQSSTQGSKGQLFSQTGVITSNRWSFTSVDTTCSCCVRSKSQSSCSRISASLYAAVTGLDILLPDQSCSRVYGWIRWNFLSAYRRLFTIIFLANMSILIGIGVLTGFHTEEPICSNAITAASVNLTISIVFRNEHVVNVLFLFSSSLPRTTPLFIRRWFAKIYAYGGIHSGCATAAVVWYLLFSGIMTYHIWIPPLADSSLAVISLLISLTLLVISVFAVSKSREYLHNWFECVHRFAGWTAILLFWSLTFLIAIKENMPTTKALIQNVSFWCLAISTFCVIYPWIRLSRQPCAAVRLSDHAIRLYFEHKDVPHCSAVRLALNPLKETHAFAAIPNRSQTAKGFSVLVSKAGDWTTNIINHQPQKLFIKGGPFFGVLRVAIMFKPVLIVATGSGIGPCLSLFHGVPNLDCRVLWSASNPVATYGEEIVSDVFQADPQALIVDTSKTGRPDMACLAYSIWKAKSCEAVVVISNPRLTRSLVYGMEIRGVPAYGPIFDS